MSLKATQTKTSSKTHRSQSVPSKQGLKNWIYPESPSYSWGSWIFKFRLSWFQSRCSLPQVYDTRPWFHVKHEFWSYHTCLAQWLCAGHLTNQGPLCCRVDWEALGHKGRSMVWLKPSVWVQCISPSNRKTDSQVSNNQSQSNFASLLKLYQLWSGFVGFEVSNFKTVTTGINPVDLAALQNHHSALILVPAPTLPIYLLSNLFSKRCVGWGWEGVW